MDNAAIPGTASADGRRGLLAASAVLATMIYTIDSTIVNVALPHMQGSLQATQDQAAWILTSYIVLGAIATPLMGWLGVRHGLRPVMLGSVLTFTIASALCGMAASLEQMVAFRALQGVAGAALVPLSQVTLLQEFPREQHARVTGLWGVGVLVGPVIGPTLGGWLTDSASWRWTFYINVPVGVLAYLGLAATMRRGEGDPRRPFDTLGFLLLGLAIGLFQLMLDRGQGQDWFDSPEIVAEAFFAALCLYMFVVHARTSRHPFVDPQLFRDRNFVMGMLAFTAVATALYAPSSLMPGFLQQLQGYDATQAGGVMAWRGLSSMLGMLLAARLMGKVDPRVLMVGGILLGSVALYLMAGFTLDTPGWRIAATGFLQGIGLPMTFLPLSMVALGTLEGPQRAEGGVLVTLARNIGSSIGISMTFALLARWTQVNTSYLGENLTPYADARWAQLGATAGDPGSSAIIAGEITRQAAAIGYVNDFRLLAATTLLALPFALLLRVPRNG
jgi:DHA2 family multidrug resistance protein